MALVVLLCFFYSTPQNSLAQTDGVAESRKQSCECDGKVSTLTLRYNGSTESTIKIEQRKEGEIFNQSIAPGGQFTINGIDNKNTLGTEISIYKDNSLATKIHTSCSVDIRIGQTFGEFTIISGQSRNNGRLCSVGENTNENSNENENGNENQNSNENNNENEPGTDIPEVSYPVLFMLIGSSIVVGLVIGMTFSEHRNNNKSS